MPRGVAGGLAEALQEEAEALAMLSRVDFDSMTFDDLRAEDDSAIRLVVADELGVSP